MTSEETTFPENNQTTSEVVNFFRGASDAVDALQDNPGFIGYMTQHNIAFDDTQEAYWDAVSFVANRSIELGAQGDPNGPEAKAFALAARAPSFMFKQLALAADQEHAKATRKPGNREGDHLLTRGVKDQYVESASNFNGMIRDFIESRIDMQSSTFTTLLTESANLGLDRNFVQKSAELMSGTVSGVRTELGFEQKLSAAGIRYRRGTTQDDVKGIDYIVEGVPIDVKSSLFKMLEEGKPEDQDKPFLFKNGKCIYYPYETDRDYADGTFKLKEDSLVDRAQQISEDIEYFKRYLHL
ncbi:MAG: hypothetical protein ABIP50_00560 [Candidatus Saccharimonadales bacterium]